MLTTIRPVQSLPLPALLLMALALVLVRVGLVSPLTAFAVFMLCWAVGGLATTLAGAWCLYRTSADHRSRALWQLTAGALMLLALVGQAARARGPAIHDITTDPDDPPEFAVATTLPDNEGRDMSYPHGGPDVPTLQRRAYPDVRPLLLAATPIEAHAAVIATADDLGWFVTWSSPTLGHVEAVDVTPLFRLRDDIAIRIRRTESGETRVDVRSTSRVGRSDLGANARRITAFTRAVARRMQVVSEPGS